MLVSCVFVNCMFVALACVHFAAFNECGDGDD